MNIAVYHDQPSGGARRALHGFCAQLVKRHRVDAYTLSTADQTMLRDEDVFSSVTRLPYATRRPIRLGVWWNDVRRLADLRTLERVNAEAAALIDARQYDVVLVDACRFTYVPLVLRALRTPTVYYCHGGSWHLSRRWGTPASAYERARRLWHLPFERARTRWLRRAEIENAGRANVIATNSTYSRGRIRETYGRDAVVCPPGVAFAPATASANHGHVISVGALEAHKGFDFVVEALATIRAGSRPPLHIIANDGNPLVRARLEALARARRVDLRIRILPSAAELEEELSTALLFAYGAHAEPLGLAPLEAMARALPVVAVGEGGVPETVAHGRTGYLTDRDPAAFGARVALIIESPRLRDALGAEGRETVIREWAWPMRAAALESILSAVGAPEHRVPAYVG